MAETADIKRQMIKSLRSVALSHFQWRNIFAVKSVYVRVKAYLSYLAVFPSVLSGGAYQMRGTALLLICLSMLIALAGCGQSQISSGTKQEETDITKQVEKTDNKENESTPIPTETKPQREENSDSEQSTPVREDVCELYLAVLEDLWNVDPGLNGGISQIGIDLSELSHLTEVEKDTVMSEFASKHDLPYIAGTWEELCEQGYIDKDNLYWKDGLFFSIKTNEEAAWNLPDTKDGNSGPELTAFDAQKWRSGLGAYYFGRCTAQKNDDGKWSYTVGQEAIA